MGISDLVPVITDLNRRDKCSIYPWTLICSRVIYIGRWGNGDVELYMEHTSDVDQIMEIVEQSYRIQAEE